MRLSRRLFSDVFRFTTTHEYIKSGTNNIGKVGITKYAVKQLGDIVFVDLSNKDIMIEKGEVVATLESVKAASDIYAPVGGVVCDNNPILEEHYGGTIINKDPQGDGWLFSIKYKKEELHDLMSEEEYTQYLKTLDE